MARVKSGSGWYDFAGAVLGIAGVLHAFAGIVGIVKTNYIQGSPVLLEIEQWAWAWLVLGVVQIIAAIVLLGGGGRMLGIVVTAISMVVLFATHRIFPHDGTLVILLDVLILYGLTVHRPDAAGASMPAPTHEIDRSTPPPLH